MYNNNIIDAPVMQGIPRYGLIIEPKPPIIPLNKKQLFDVINEMPD